MTGWVNASLSMAVFKGLTVALHQLFGIEQWKAARSRLAICSMTGKLWHFITASSSSLSLLPSLYFSFSLSLFFSSLTTSQSLWFLLILSVSLSRSLSDTYPQPCVACGKSGHHKAHGSIQHPFSDTYTVINMCFVQFNVNC